VEAVAEVVAGNDDLAFLQTVEGPEGCRALRIAAGERAGGDYAAVADRAGLREGAPVAMLELKEAADPLAPARVPLLGAVDPVQVQRVEIDVWMHAGEHSLEVAGVEGVEPTPDGGLVGMRGHASAPREIPDGPNRRRKSRLRAHRSDADARAGPCEERQRRRDGNAC